MKQYERKIFMKYPQLLVGRSVYFISSIKIQEAINDCYISGLTANKLYKIQAVTGNSGCSLCLIHLIDNHTYPIKTVLDIAEEQKTSSHLRSLTAWKLHSTR